MVKSCVLLMIGILLPVVGFSQSILNQQNSEVYIEFPEPRPLGEIVYQTDSYGNDWNGRTNDGAELDNGVYFYRIIHSDTKRIWKGYIQLIR